ncbi:LysR family transcriptional regulator [Falsirhodobacter halotolerans]|uniref:LysR family transcriptional regulator n=1 Tax=Falsirhodobacter halotolerans TaxID=1146892 RepID=UPI001FD3659F|nr:LysR family transcriptional regulator [Falsirhodobacter halotolerans]MCJ8138303.1 LysR family transcriptional regulator [Falsirhodobacter halotolerans]
MIDKLEMFILLASERHFGRASEKIGITQPSFSAAIRQLEEKLGVQLVRRGSRFQGLTPEGDRLLVWAQRIVGDARAMRAEFQALRHGVTGQLRLGVIPTAVSHLSRLTVPMLDDHPNLDLTVEVGSATDIVQQIDMLTLDAGVIYATPLSDKFVQLPLYRERLELLVHRDDPLARAPSVDWPDLREVPLCLLSSNMRNREIVMSHLLRAGRTRAPRVESNSMLGIISHVEQGQWASVIPDGLLDLVRHIPHLVTRPLSGAGDEVALAYLAREPRPQKLEALLSSVRRRTARRPTG